MPSNCSLLGGLTARALCEEVDRRLDERRAAKPRPQTPQERLEAARNTLSKLEDLLDQGAPPCAGEAA